MYSIKLPFQMMRRDWRAGELNVLLLALIIAVSGMVTVGFFAERVELALARESNQLLGADLLLISSKPIPGHFAEEAGRSGLKTSSLTKFPSMISNGEGNLLTQIKAVTDGYPLRGRVYLSSQPSSAAASQPQLQAADGIPSRGTIWVDEKVMAQLALRSGDVVEVGATQLIVTELIVREPDHSVGFINMGRARHDKCRRPGSNRFDPGRQPCFLPIAACR